MINNLSKKMNYLNLKISPSIYYILKLFSTFLLFGLLMLVQYGYIIAPICSIVYFCLFDLIILDMNIVSRINELEEDAIGFFDVFLLSFSSVKNIKKALENTCRSLKNEMSLEFEKTLKDVSLGRSFDDALQKMIDRIPSSVIGNMILLIKEGNRSGNNISSGIEKQLDCLRLEKDKKVLFRYKMLPLKMFLCFAIFMFVIFLFIILFNNII